MPSVKPPEADQGSSKRQSRTRLKIGTAPYPLDEFVHFECRTFCRSSPRASKRGCLRAELHEPRGDSRLLLRARRSVQNRGRVRERKGEGHEGHRSKPIVLARVRRYLATGRAGQPTRIPKAIVREENPPARPGPGDRLYYRWYAKEFKGVMRLLRQLTGGRFRDGAVARVVAMEFWTRGEAPIFEEFARSWTRAKAEEHRLLTPEYAYLMDLQNQRIDGDWKALRKAKAKSAIETLGRVAPVSRAGLWIVAVIVRRKHVIRVSEDRAADEFRSLLREVRARADVVIEHRQSTGRGSACCGVRSPVSLCPHRDRQRAREQTGTAPILDADFAEDVEGILKRREPWNPPSWQE
jgi:hypothetical protein